MTRISARTSVSRRAAVIGLGAAESVPSLVIHGDIDSDVPVEHSRRLVDALHEANVEVTYGEYPNAEHLSTMHWIFCGPRAPAFLGLHLHPQR